MDHPLESKQPSELACMRHYYEMPVSEETTVHVARLIHSLKVDHEGIAKKVGCHRSDRYVKTEEYVVHMHTLSDAEPRDV